MSMSGIVVVSCDIDACPVVLKRSISTLCHEKVTPKYKIVITTIRHQN